MNHEFLNLLWEGFSSSASIPKGRNVAHALLYSPWESWDECERPGWLREWRCRAKLEAGKRHGMLRSTLGMCVSKAAGIEVLQTPVVRRSLLYEGCSLAAVRPGLRAGKWLLLAQWSTDKSPMAQNVSGYSEKPVIQDESSSRVLSRCFLYFFVFSVIIPFIFLSVLFFLGCFCCFSPFLPLLPVVLFAFTLFSLSVIVAAAAQ